MNKVWLHTFWMGWGEIQPAALVQPAEGVQPVFQRAWLRAVHPPYYRGAGVAIRLGRNTLRFGICYPIGKLTLPDDLDTIYTALHGRQVDKETEGTWDSEDKSA